MNFKRSTTSMAIALMALSLISMTSIQQDAFAASSGMSITATADRGSDTITVTGMTSSDYTDVTFTVWSPSGNNLVAAWQTSPDEDGNFDAKFTIGPSWTEDGFYKIQAMQSQGIFSLSVHVEVNNGMTENIFETESTLETGIFVQNLPTTTRDAGLEIYAEAEIGSNMITITGETDRVSQDIVLTVTAPNGNIVSIDQVSPMLNGEFYGKCSVY